MDCLYTSRDCSLNKEVCVEKGVNAAPFYAADADSFICILDMA
jgi:hypothetical protein